MRRSVWYTACLAALLLASIPAACEAAWPYPLDYFGWYPRYSPYAYQLEKLPHYALYPPVYYSYRWARPYGFSPFASPFDVMVIEVAAEPARKTPEPKMIRNPFVKEEKPRTGAWGPGRSGPLVVKNPFVAQATSEADLARALK